jgi:hypothetical protein
MVSNSLTKQEWDYIQRNYFSGYCMTTRSQVDRKNRRALYLANQEYIKNYGPNRRIMTYNQWYIANYNKTVPKAQMLNVIPCRPNP